MHEGIFLKRDIFKAISGKSTEEFYTPIPQGYMPGKTKYIVVAGTVMSGIGKGISASSIAKLLQYFGLKIAPIKIDGYFNQDAGTLNPYRHGEVFVLDDGTECDMDLGSYERYLEQTLTKDNYLTAGMIFRRVLDRERKGGYLGRDVQFIPHVTGEVKYALRNLAVKSGADIVLCEIGGTIGDYENSYIIESIRELRYEEGADNVCFINISYILEPPNLGEQKSKPAQLGLHRLLELGIQPDMVICRAANPVSARICEKISLYSNVPIENVIGLHDTDSVYKAPLLLKLLKADERVVSILNLNRKISFRQQRKELAKWEKFTKQYVNAQKTITIGVAGKYTGLNDSYASIIKALEHAGTFNDTKVKIKYIETTDIELGKTTAEEQLKDINGLIIPGGFGKRGIEGKVACAKYARENNLPFLGICLGMQVAVIEFARNICGLKDANSTEFDPATTNPVIDILPEQKELQTLGGNMRLGAYPAKLKKGTKIYELYGKEDVSERHRHRYEVNPGFIKSLESSGIVFSGVSPDTRLMEFLELGNHPYFAATQAHPEFKSRPMKPAPLFDGLIKAALKKSQSF